SRAPPTLASYEPRQDAASFPLLSFLHHATSIPAADRRPGRWSRRLARVDATRTRGGHAVRVPVADHPAGPAPSHPPHHRGPSHLRLLAFQQDSWAVSDDLAHAGTGR